MVASGSIFQTETRISSVGLCSCYASAGVSLVAGLALLRYHPEHVCCDAIVGICQLTLIAVSGEFCAHTMLQHDAWGEPLCRLFRSRLMRALTSSVVHYNLLKQIPSGVGRFFSWGRTKQLPLFNTFPALPSTARLGEPLEKPNDDDRRGLGDVDCDMLADADEYGNARAPAKEMIMRRAVRERGVKARFHGGSVSALWSVAPL